MANPSFPLHHRRWRQLSAARIWKLATPFAGFVRALGLPTRLADVGIGEDKFVKISKVAINHRFVHANPRPFKSEADIVDLLRMSA